ncbi:uncharacterized protein LOC114278695 isoform X2 [Camellia sinensis]|uniref:uncharacterized protein LOC114278695 isoform X2 n=1 Tax=Camellia sinensis TaxID=4442 RepID=UPI001036DC02|nr:uncharacterized protein LOC114278695 isoform X2 [Camellia sinensis]
MLLIYPRLLIFPLYLSHFLCSHLRLISIPSLSLPASLFFFFPTLHRCSLLKLLSSPRFLPLEFVSQGKILSVGLCLFFNRTLPLRSPLTLRTRLTRMLYSKHKSGSLTPLQPRQQYKLKIFLRKVDSSEVKEIPRFKVKNPKRVVFQSQSEFCKVSIKHFWYCCSWQAIFLTVLVGFED